MNDDTTRSDLSGVPRRPVNSAPDVSAEMPNSPKKPETRIPDAIGNKYLRKGDNFYRTAREKPVFSVKGETIRIASDAALHDAVKIAKANDWSSVTVKGSAAFKRSVYMIAAKQGLAVEGYRATELERLEVERAITKAALRSAKSKGGKAQSAIEEADKSKARDKALSERFLAQSHRKNRRDPELRDAQSLVAAAVIVARDRYPDNPARRKEFVGETKQQIAGSIVAGKPVKGLQPTAAQHETIQERIRQNLFAKENTKTRER